MRSRSALFGHFMKIVIFAAVVVLIAPAASWGAQDTTVIVDNTPIRLEPDPSGQVLEYLPTGAEIRISAYPLPGGWYRVRSKNGEYGWVNADNLSVKKPNAVDKDGAVEAVRPERDRRWYLRGLMGLDFFRPDNLNDLYSFRELSMGYAFGGEIGFMATRNIAIEVRFEGLSKSVVARESSTQVIYNVSVASYPVMAGLDFYFATLPALRISFGVFGGLALGTSFSSQAASYAAPNEVVLQENPFTTLARLNITRPLGRVLSVFIEGGYRYLATNQLDTSAAQYANGGAAIFGRAGVYNPRIIDLSGFIGSVGVGLHF